MRKLVLSKTFEKSYMKFIRKNSYLKKNIDKALKLLEEDIFLPQLKTHKLSGNLFGAFACSCGYDCRILFTLEKDKTSR